MPPMGVGGERVVAMGAGVAGVTWRPLGLGGKVSAYIRKLETVLKAAQKGTVVVEGAIHQVP